ncbi:hypothetical protein [Ralstonia pseudosolanacearum]|uniref:hypothetical protein n=1 Tax=Ralstonia pseudosolanacearum TaxID=1310165 RepID=UPI003CEEE52C
MVSNNVIEALHRMRKYGFQIRVAPSIATAPKIERAYYAVQAAASVLYNIDPGAFDDGGTWEPVRKHVLDNGLRNLVKLDAKRLQLNEVQLASVNAAISFARELFEHAEAMPS